MSDVRFKDCEWTESIQCITRRLEAILASENTCQPLGPILDIPYSIISLPPSPELTRR
jgi:hypothetical protein